ncbi:MAG: DUF1800 domain-containing protein [Bacteroidota bacterium]
MIISPQLKIQHLFWRAGFGLSPKEFSIYHDWSIDKTVDHLMKASVNPEPFGQVKPAFQTREELRRLSEEEKKQLQKMNRNTLGKLSVSWLERMGDPNRPALIEKMTLFWHDHFASDSKLPHFSVKQQNTIRKHALGNFRDLVLAIAKDPMMIQYLNNQQNKKQRPNENFARELMELFTIGIGNYTENDIKEAARAFTGWTTNLRGEFVFRSNWHDYGLKTFMGKSGRFDGDQIIDIILERKETAQYIAGKIYRFFVNEKIDVSRVNDLADRFYRSNYDIGQLMAYIFKSDWFYSSENIGSKIKSPAELIGGMIRTLGLEFEDFRSLLFTQRALGQVLLKPPNVAGWPGGKAWIDNATLMVRLNLAGWLFDSTEVNFKLKEAPEMRSYNLKNRKIKATIDIEPIINAFSGYPENVLFAKLSGYLLQSGLVADASKLERFVSDESKEKFIASLVLRLMSLPEYQMC